MTSCATLPPLPGDLQFAAGAKGTLLINLSGSDATYDDPNLPSNLDPVIGAYGVQLAVDGGIMIGGITIGETSVNGSFLINIDGDEVTLAGSGQVNTGPFDQLLGLSAVDMTVVGGWKIVADGGVYGALLLDAGESYSPGPGSFFDLEGRATFDLAFNTTATSQTIQLSGYPNLPPQLLPYLTIPSSTFRAFATGTANLSGFGMDATYMAQVSPTGLELFADGSLRVPHLGNVNARGALRFASGGGVAAELTLNSGSSHSFAASGFSFSGTTSFAVNTTSAPFGLTPAGTLANMRVDGDLSALGLNADGVFTVTVSGSGLAASVTGASLDIGPFQNLFGFSGAFSILGSGLSASINNLTPVGGSLSGQSFVGTLGNGFDLDGSFALDLNTATSTARVAVTNATVDVFGFNTSGSADIMVAGSTLQISNLNASTSFLGNGLNISGGQISVRPASSIPSSQRGFQRICQ